MVRGVYSGSQLIPVRNIWLLMLYASDFYRQVDANQRSATEENPEDIPDLAAEILARAVERRLARNLSFGWQTRKEDLNQGSGPG